MKNKAIKGLINCFGCVIWCQCCNVIVCHIDPSLRPVVDSSQQMLSGLCDVSSISIPVSNFQHLQLLFGQWPDLMQHRVFFTPQMLPPAGYVQDPFISGFRFPATAVFNIAKIQHVIFQKNKMYFFIHWCNENLNIVYWLHNLMKWKNTTYLFQNSQSAVDW